MKLSVFQEKIVFIKCAEKWQLPYHFEEISFHGTDLEVISLNTLVKCMGAEEYKKWKGQGAEGVRDASFFKE